MKFIIAIDSLKGCLTSAEANHAAAEEIRSLMPNANIIELPVSDGGEGWLTPFVERLGWQPVDCQAHDPLNRPIRAFYATNGHCAAIEIAQACGLTLLSPNELNPLVTTTRGVGDIIVHVVEHGTREFIVGLGGSATSDAGMGMIDVLREKGIMEKTDHLRFTIATDVQNPLCGHNGAAHVFAPQKGATPAMVEQLDERARRFAATSAHLLGHDFSNAPGAGAAGGLGYAFMQYLNAQCRPGAHLLMDLLHFDQLVSDADLIITGEGRADRQTLMGKLPFAVMKGTQVPTLLLAGQVSDRHMLLNAGFKDAICINPPDTPLDVALQKDIAIEGIKQAIRTYLSSGSNHH